MTDGRIPGKWMNEPRFIEMGADTWCVFTKAIAWSNEAGTDGLIKRRYLSLLHPNGEQPRSNAELVALGLWSEVPDGYQFTDWNKKAHHGGLGQELAENVRAHKERKKTNQQHYRDRQAGASHVTGHVTDAVTGHVGQERTGQETTAIKVESSANENENEQREIIAPWDRVDLGTGEVFDSNPHYIWQTVDGRRQKVPVSA